MSLPTNLNTVHFRAWSSICEFTAVADLCACYLACYKLTLAAKAKIFTPLLPPDICAPKRLLHHTPKHYHGKTVLAVSGLPTNAAGLCTLTMEGITVNHNKFCSALLYTYLQRHAIQMSLSLSPHPNSSSSPSPSLSPGLSPSPSPRKCSPSNALRATG